MPKLAKRSTLLRAVAASLILATSALGAGAIRNNGDFKNFLDLATGQRQADKRYSDPDGGTAQEHSNEVAVVGQRGEKTPLSAEEEKYTRRAYPATDIPIVVTKQAKAAFTNVRVRGQAANTPGPWIQIGPSTAVFPPSLTFTGAQYLDSGRITALASSTSCTALKCTLWVAAAGGGVWRTDRALASSPNWTFTSGSFGTNAIGTLTYDAPSHTLYAGTGEPNASADSEAGVGVYASTDDGKSWGAKLAATTTVGTYTGSAFDGRSISSIVVDPSDTTAKTLYVSTTRGVRGVSSDSGGATSFPPVAAPWGLYKSTDGGATFSLIWDGAATPRGVNHVELDPSNPAIVYAAAFQEGVYRSTDGGATWTQIKAALNPTLSTDRAEFAVTKLGTGSTRMYVGVGASSGVPAHFYRTDDAVTATDASFTDLTTPQNINYCTGQCWYDNFVYSPKGQPNTVYLLGSYDYNTAGVSTNGRGVLFSTDGGSTFTDMTRDASSPTTPNGIHPDQHAIVVNPSNPNIFFEGSDGGLVRSSGTFADISAQCAARNLSGTDLTTCQGLLARVPSQLSSLNAGLSTLQFQSLSVNPNNVKDVMGGTQDNGTFETTGSRGVWNQVIYGDGGQSGFDVGNPAIRFNQFYGGATDENFRNGDTTKWVVTSGPLLNSGEPVGFYWPEITDPRVPGTQYTGFASVWRTKDNGGNQAYLEANCPEFTTSASDPNCGDWVKLGPSQLTSTDFGADRTGGYGAQVERATGDTSTLWAATTTGRVFISKNADAEPASSVTFKRLDSLAAAAPNRFVSSIYIDPQNANHAWISYSGYNTVTPTTPGHVFEVTYNPTAGTATWVPLDGGIGPMGDLPVTDLVRDDVTGDLYAATDFGVLRLPSGTTTWVEAAGNLPEVEVAGLTIVPGSRTLYAATHGRSAWSLKLR